MAALADGVTLYFIRHGQTEWNRLRRLQGQIDVPLNDIGRAQAAGNGRRLRDIRSDLDSIDFVASPLSRTVETMELVREAAGLPQAGYRTDARLKEVNYGHWEGCFLEELKRQDPVEYQQRRDDKFNWRPRGGESYRDLTQRVAGWLAEIDRDSAVVSHGGVNRVLRGLVETLDLSEIPVLDVPQDRILVLRGKTGTWV